MGQGQPRKFETKEEVIEWLNEFIQYVKVKKKFKIIPSKFNFVTFLIDNGIQLDRRTLFNYTNVYFPELKKEIAEIIGECMVEGAMLGNYNNVMTIFTLKNWCGYSDKPVQEEALDKIDLFLKKLEVEK